MLVTRCGSDGLDGVRAVPCHWQVHEAMGQAADRHGILVQLLTTAAVIIISIFKGVDAFGGACGLLWCARYQRKQAPENLAFGIVFLLTCGVALFGYLFMRFKSGGSPSRWRRRRRRRRPRGQGAGQGAGQGRGRGRPRRQLRPLRRSKPPAVAPEAEKAPAAPRPRLRRRQRRCRARRLEMSPEDGGGGQRSTTGGDAADCGGGRTQGLSQDEMQMRIMMVRQSRNMKTKSSRA